MSQNPEISPGHFHLPVTASRVRADWASRGYSCHEFNDPPGQAWNDFVHDTHEVVTVVEGRLELLIEAERFIAENEPDDANAPSASATAE